MIIFRKKPVIVKTVRWMTDNYNEVANFLGQGDCSFNSDGRSIFLKTPEGVMEASPFDYIIQGVKGEFYPCKPDIFELTYERENLVDEKIKDALLSYRCQYTQTDEGGADLIDVLTPSDENDRKSGTKELELLSEHIACALVEE
jgi:hypothetical protein